MTPYLGQIVEYRYKPESTAPALAAMVTAVHDPGADGKDWVALCVFSEVARWCPHVEYALHCKPAAEPAAPAAPTAEHPNTGFNGLPWGFHP